MKKIAILFFTILLLSLSSCKMKLTTTIPNLIVGKWQHIIESGNNAGKSDRCLIMNKEGKYSLTGFGIEDKTGEYTMKYDSFHITEASGTILFDEKDSYNFVWHADPELGPLKLSVTDSEKVTYVYTYDGDALL